MGATKTPPSKAEGCRAASSLAAKPDASADGQRTRRDRWGGSIGLGMPPCGVAYSRMQLTARL
jgi:hypothetical protein